MRKVYKGGRPKTRPQPAFPKAIKRQGVVRAGQANFNLKFDRLPPVFGRSWTLQHYSDPIRIQKEIAHQSMARLRVAVFRFWDPVDVLTPKLPPYGQGANASWPALRRSTANPASRDGFNPAERKWAIGNELNWIPEREAGYSLFRTTTSNGLRGSRSLSHSRELNDTYSIDGKTTLETGNGNWMIFVECRWSPRVIRRKVNGKTIADVDLSVHRKARELVDRLGRDCFNLTQTLEAILGGTELPMRPAVVLLPGIMGSTLRTGNSSDVVWPASKTGKLFDPVRTGFSKLLCDANGRPEKNYVAFGLINDYNPLIAYLESLGYVAGNDLIPFPYDWRLDNKQQLAALDAKVKVASGGGTRNVVLVAHSMGGLIARAYAYQNPGRVKKIITLGTPYHGSADALASIATGYFNQYYGFAVGDTNTRPAVLNYASVYQLLPEISVATLEGKRLPVDVVNSLQFPAINGKGPRVTLSPALLKKAKAFRELVQPGNPTPPVETHAIVGLGVSTIDHIALRRLDDESYLGYFFKRENWEPFLGDRSIHLPAPDGRKMIGDLVFADGDGTVPVWGSRLAGATRWEVRDGIHGSARHGSLPSNRRAQEIVGALLGLTQSAPTSDDAGPKSRSRDGQTTIIIRSAGALRILDANGNTAGFDEQGEPIGDLTRATVRRTGLGEYVAVAGLDEPLRVRVTGTRKGTFTLEVRLAKSGKPAGDFYYREVPVEAGTVSELAFTPRKLDATPPSLVVTHKGASKSIPAVVRIPPSQQQLARSEEASPEADGDEEESAEPEAAGSGWLLILCVLLLAAAGVGGFLFLRRARSPQK